VSGLGNTDLIQPRLWLPHILPDDHYG